MADTKTTSLEGQELTELESITTPSGDYLLLVHDGNGAKKITIDDLLIPRSVDMANRMPRIAGPKTMTHTELISHLSEIANNDFTNVRLGDIVTFGNNQVYIAEFNRNYSHYGYGFPNICLMTCTHYDGYGYGTLMNDTSTTDGGFYSSKCNQTHLANINTDLAKYFGSYLATVKHSWTNAVSNGVPTGWSYYDGKAFIPSSAETFGCIPYPINNGRGVNMNIDNGYQQLALFKIKPELICNGEYWWMRDITSASTFAVVGNYGAATHHNATVDGIALRVGFIIKLTA